MAIVPTATQADEEAAKEKSGDELMGIGVRRIHAGDLPQAPVLACDARAKLELKIGRV
jgi:hypothetical protein